jgi:hypothetical protein
LFESIAQVYLPVDIRGNKLNGLFAPVVSLGRKLRVLLSYIYTTAITNQEFRSRFGRRIRDKYTGIGKDGNLEFNLPEYATYIGRNQSWANDDDASVLSSFLNIPFKIIQNGTNSRDIVLRINPDPYSTENIQEELYYTLCNTLGSHFVLQKHNNPKPNNIDDIINSRLPAPAQPGSQVNSVKERAAALNSTISKPLAPRIGVQPRQEQFGYIGNQRVIKQQANLGGFKNHKTKRRNRS